MELSKEEQNIIYEALKEYRKTHKEKDISSLISWVSIAYSITIDLPF